MSRRVKDMRASAGKGNALGLALLGQVLQLGEQLGIGQDIGTAADCFRQAAEDGNAIGQLSYAEVLEKGLGVARDLSAAGSWYKKAADHGGRTARQAYAAVRRELGDE
jgi:TPR repeat protein